MQSDSHYPSLQHTPMTTVIDPHIASVVRTMCQERPWLGTRKGAFRNCYNTSLDPTRRLQNAGYQARVTPIRVQQLDSCHPHWKRFAGREHCIAHYAVRCRNFPIDLTARQFDATASFPRILHTRR